MKRLTRKSLDEYAYLNKADTAILNIGETPDILYWGQERYLIDRSFLSVINGHKSIYPDLCSMQKLFPIKTQGEIQGDKYSAQWLLKDNMLYLRNIDFYDERVDKLYPARERYSKMEKFAGSKFQKSKNDEFNRLEPKQSMEGSMKATWVNGVFHVKKTRKDPGETLKEWLNTS